MKEDEDLTMGHGGTRIHVRGTCPLARPENPCASGRCLLNPDVLTRGGHDDFCICNSRKILEVVQGLGKTPCVIPGRDDDGKMRVHGLFIAPLGRDQVIPTGHWTKFKMATSSFRYWTWPRLGQVT